MSDMPPSGWMDTVLGALGGGGATWAGLWFTQRRSKAQQAIDKTAVVDGRVNKLIETMTERMNLQSERITTLETKADLQRIAWEREHERDADYIERLRAHIAAGSPPPPPPYPPTGPINLTPPSAGSSS